MKKRIDTLNKKTRIDRRGLGELVSSEQEDRDDMCDYLDERDKKFISEPEYLELRSEPQIFLTVNLKR